jgi:hypothetical protein
VIPLCEVLSGDQLPPFGSERANQEDLIAFKQGIQHGTKAVLVGTRGLSLRVLVAGRIGQKLGDTFERSKDRRVP